MAESKYLYMTLTEASKLIKSREISPVDLTQFCLDRIDSIDEKLNSFITICHQHAMSAAKKAEGEIINGTYHGPMHGIPYAVKDIYMTKNIKSTSGSKVFQNYVPDHNCKAVDNLNQSGGILVGKNNCAEFASGGDDSSLVGPCHNPWKWGYTPGGSSSGSGASVAAGLIFGSMGSCTGGSIRGPASHCSIVGLKPTYGLVSRSGVFPLSWSIDHAGPMTRTVSDCALMLQSVAGYDPNDPSSVNIPYTDYYSALTGNINGIRVGILREFFEQMPPEVSTLITNALKVLEKLGASIEEISAPLTALYSTTAGNLITWSEAAQIHNPWLQQIDNYSIGVREKVMVGLVIPSDQYHKAQQMRRLVKQELEHILTKVDVIVGHVTKPPGPLQIGDKKGTATGMATELSGTRLYNLTGLPAVSVPCGFSEDGLPIGLQIAGQAFEDAKVLNTAFAYEQATKWHKMHPPI